jgi:ribonucleotide reductase alpha subunit
MYQNENLSVRVSDEFMTAARDGKEWWTKTVAGKSLQKKDASTLLDKIAQGTWICGDPGLQYDGAIQKWHTCKGTEPDSLHQSVQRIRVPQQHRVQSRVAEPDEVQEAGHHL